MEKISVEEGLENIRSGNYSKEEIDNFIGQYKSIDGYKEDLIRATKQKINYEEGAGFLVRWKESGNLDSNKELKGISRLQEFIEYLSNS